MSKILVSELGKFYSGLEAGFTSFREIRGIFDEQIAFEFNSLSNFFWPNENKISFILAFFLNPHANHAQKDTFFRIFMNHFDLEMNACTYNRIEIKTEYHTDINRRIDIVIEIQTENPKPFLIGIENKIYEWTNEQPKQLEHYASFLEKQSDGNYCLFYLTPYGNEASDQSISENIARELHENNKLKEISFASHIIDLFEKFELACKADNVRAFLKDFNHYLKQQYRGEKVMGEKEFMINFVKDHPKIIKYQNEINIAINKIQQTIFDQILLEIKKHFHTDHEEKYKHKNSGSFEIYCSDVESKGLRFSIYYESNPHFFMMMGADKKYADEVTSKLLESKKEELRQVAIRIKSKGFEGSHDGYWNCGTFHFYDKKFFENMIAPLLDDQKKLDLEILKIKSRLKEYMQLVGLEWENLKSNPGTN